MPTRIDTVIKLILQEAKERKGFKDYPGKIYDVSLDVHLRVAEILKTLRDQEREDAKKKGGG